jgi:hypothetical protein
MIASNILLKWFQNLISSNTFVSDIDRHLEVDLTSILPPGRSNGLELNIFRYEKKI